MVGDFKNWSPVQVDTGHTHWIWNLRYNPFHDRLLLSSGSDNRCILYNNFEASSDNIKKTKWHLSDTTSLSPSESSEASESDNCGIKPTSIPDGIIASYDDFEDSVYSLAWS